MNYFFCICFAINLCLITCLPEVFRGRPLTKYGMVGLPVSEEEFLANERPLDPLWVKQKLDHFDPGNSKTWEQRYWYSKTHYEGKGPIFLFMDGEGAASPSWLSYGQMSDNAIRHKAMTIVLEHRYYGESHPTEDLSVENLKFLSSRQALEDTAFFIEYFTANHSLNGSQWVVFGGSYAGALAAWFRSKYPHLVVGAVASSAPINVELNFKEYLGVVSQSLGKKCDDAIREATTQMTEELKTPEGCEKITEQFNLCDPIDGTDTNDVNYFLLKLASRIMSIVQYNENRGYYEAVFGTDSSIGTIGWVCEQMIDETNRTRALDRYIKLNVSPQCLDHKYEKLVDFMSKTEWSSLAGMGARQWTYQTCTEFGYYQTGDLATQPFGHYFPVDYYLQQCRDFFGPQFTPEVIKESVEKTNTFYGGLGISVKKVVFPNGSIDPWHALGVLKDLNDEAPAVFINGTSHCADMSQALETDPKSLSDARHRISDALNKFLNEK